MSQFRFLKGYAQPKAKRKVSAPAIVVKNTGPVVRLFSKDGEPYYVKLAAIGASGGKILLPTRDGRMFETDCQIEVKAGEDAELVSVEVLEGEKKVRDFLVDAKMDKKSATSILANPDDQKSLVVDYQDVEIKGYASTFVGTTSGDRMGDYILDGAFRDTIPAFKRNPVMLIDHCNSCNCVAGSFTKLVQDQTGLAIEATISNAPGMKDIRFKIVEEHIRALSIGGLFNYTADGRGIEEVNLYEISLVAVPMNPDALVSVKKLDLTSIGAVMKSLRLAGRTILAKPSRL